MRKRLLSLTLTLILSLTLAASCYAAESKLKSFSDVPSDHWAHDAIMEMVDMGLLAGTTAPDANGIGTFNPSGTMNRSHFIVVMARYLYGGELSAMANGTAWYSNAYSLLLKHGILSKSDFDNGNLEVAMSRQEMAYVLAAAAEAEGKEPAELVTGSNIPDWSSIGAVDKRNNTS